MKKSKKTAAFMSYAHIDDHDGKLSEFRNHLANAVTQIIGKKFEIFQDSDIIPGESWNERIEERLDVTFFFIPIISPSFFNSKYCRDELQKFLDRENELNRHDLIIPIYYIETPLIDRSENRANDKIAQTIADRQYVDWLGLRRKPLDSPEVGLKLDTIGRSIAKSLNMPTKKKPKPIRPTTNENNKIKIVQEHPKSNTLIVDAKGNEDATSINEAIKHANPGDKIKVRPGIYKGGLVIEKPLDISGESELGEVIVQAEGESALISRTTLSSVSGLILQQISGDHCVSIFQGHIEINGCNIISQSGTGISIHGEADPHIHHCLIHGNNGSGILVSENGQGTIEDNDIFGNTGAGLEVTSGANPAIRRNLIHDGKNCGVLVTGNGRGTIEDNDIFGNTGAGLEVTDGANPAIRHNRIYDGKNCGVLVSGNGQGTIEDNDIFGNAGAGMEVINGTNPIIRLNRVYGGNDCGLLILEKGRGIIEENDIFSNARSGVEILSKGDPILRRNRIHDGKDTGIFVHMDGKGTIEDNEIFSNAFAGVAISELGNPKIRFNNIHSGKLMGIQIYEKGLGNIEGNNIFDNAFAGVEITTGGNPLMLRNRIHDGKDCGILVSRNGLSTLEENDILSNAKDGVCIISGRPILRRNRINNNGGYAIYIYKEGAGIIERNDLRDNNKGTWDIDGMKTGRSDNQKLVISDNIE